MIHFASLKFVFMSTCLFWQVMWDFHRGSDKKFHWKIYLLMHNDLPKENIKPSKHNNEDIMWD